MIGLGTEIDEQRRAVTQLVVAAQEGDRLALGELFTRYRAHVVGIAMRRVRDEHEAQELCQEVFLQALRKLPQLRQPECFVSWLTSIAHRMSLNHVTRRAPATATEPHTLATVCMDERTPNENAEEHERAEQIRGGLQRLRALDRDTLTAFYIRGQSLLEMSDHFQAPVGTIKRRLHVARQRLAEVCGVV